MLRNVDYNVVVDELSPGERCHLTLIISQIFGCIRTSTQREREWRDDKNYVSKRKKKKRGKETKRKGNFNEAFETVQVQEKSEQTS